jgi:hypothetical protein
MTRYRVVDAPADYESWDAERFLVEKLRFVKGTALSPYVPPQIQ